MSATDQGTFVEAVDWLCTYFSMLLIAVGCVCNPLSFVVFSRKSFRDSTMSIYLRVLAISDMGVLLNGLLPFVIERTPGIEMHLDDTTCVLHKFVYFSLLYTSSWTLVIVSSERVVSIVWPHRVHILCSPSACKGMLLLLILVLPLGVLSLLCALLYKNIVALDPVLNITTVLECVSVYDSYMTLPLFITDSIMFAFLPSFILIVSNIIIVSGVARSRKKVLGHKDHMQQTRQPVIDSSNSCRKTETVAILNHERPIALKQKRRKVAKEISLTLTLVAISSTFVLCNFPVCAWGFMPMYMSDGTASAQDFATVNLLVILMYINNSLNFVLYCINGSKFRSELRTIFQDCARFCGVKRR